MDMLVISEAPWSLLPKHKAVAVTDKAPHSPVAPTSKIFLKGWYTGTKRKEAKEHVNDLVTPKIEILNVCSSQSELDSACVDFEGTLKKTIGYLIP